MKKENKQKKDWLEKAKHEIELERNKILEEIEHIDKELRMLDAVDELCDENERLKKQITDLRAENENLKQQLEQERNNRC